EISEEAEKFDDEANIFAEKRKGLIRYITVIIDNVTALSDEISSFGDISEWLQDMTILSRIELTRSINLAGMKESVDDMAELVERIQTQIGIGDKQVMVFINSTSKVFDEYQKYAEEEMRFLSELAGAFSNNMAEISRVNSSFSNSLLNFDFFTKEFYELFNESGHFLDRLRAIVDNLGEIKKDLLSRNEKVRSVLEKSLGGVGVSEWKITDDNMNSIIERFTIYSHKKTAGAASGIAVEESVLDAGEVTLF
ncbi:MAG: hypothetical protein PQJ46_08850, partial [Spirochaetales bacterium]|nr:hypothetical protein [Spirochaetales bacterium]